MAIISINDTNYIYDKWMIGGAVLPVTQSMASEYVAHHPISINPARHAEKVGDITVNGNSKQLWIKHAGDVLAFDPKNGKVLLITHKDPPGPGLLALAGGMFDPSESGAAVETLAKVIDKETGEEVGKALREKLATITPVAVLDRRLITTDHRERGRSNDGNILVGDIIAMTSAAPVYVANGLSNIIPKAGDDALTANFYSLADLDQKKFALREHCQMIREGAKAAGLDHLLPANFGLSAFNEAGAEVGNLSTTINEKGSAMTELNFKELTNPRSVPTDKADNTQNVFLTGYSAAPTGYAEPTQAYVAGLVDTLQNEGKKVTLVTSPTASGQSIDAIGTVVGHLKGADLLYVTGKAYLEYVKPEELPPEANKQKFVDAPKYFFQNNDDYSLASAVVADVLVVTGGRDTAVLDFMHALQEGKPVILLNNPALPTGWNADRKRPENAAEYITKMIEAVAYKKALPYPAVKGFDGEFIKANLKTIAQLVAVDDVKKPEYLQAPSVVPASSGNLLGRMIHRQFAKN